MREQGLFDPARLVFIDETSANTKMARLYGRCARGERLVDLVPQGHWKTITFVAALRQNGMTAPCTIDGAMTGKGFLTYVERRLARTLKRNDIVMVDNLPAHKAAGVREAIEARGATQFPRPEPDRDAFQPDEGGSAQGGRAHNSSPAPPHRLVRPQAHRPPSRQLFQARRLRVKSIGIRSSSLRKQARLFEIGAHNINQFFARLCGGVAELWFNKIRAYVVFDYFGHQRIQCASRGGDEQEDVGAVVLVLKSTPYGFDLAKDTPDTFDLSCILLNWHA